MTTISTSSPSIGDSPAGCDREDGLFIDGGRGAAVRSVACAVELAQIVLRSARGCPRLETLRCRILDAIATDSSTASRRTCSMARVVSSWISRSAFLRMPAASADRFLAQLLAEPVGGRAAPRDDRLAFHARVGQDLRRVLLHAFEIRLAFSASSIAFAISFSRRIERGQQRPPGELREQRHERQERDNRPDEQAGIGLNQRIVHERGPFYGYATTSVLFRTMSSAEDFRENRDAFEQEQRQVGGAADLRGRTRLPGRLPQPRRPPAFQSRDPAPMTTSPRPIPAPAYADLLELPPCVLLPPDTNVSGAREWPCQ